MEVRARRRDHYAGTGQRRVLLYPQFRGGPTGKAVHYGGGRGGVLLEGHAAVGAAAAVQAGADRWRGADRVHGAASV